MIHRLLHITSNEGGSVLLEFALSLPALLLCFSLICQLAHVMVAKQVVAYAAACAARATLVAPTGETSKRAATDAATTVLSGLFVDQAPVVNVSIADAEESEGMRRGEVCLTLTYRFPLLVPMVGAMISNIAQNNNGEQEPYMIMTEKCLIVKPYSTRNFPRKE